MGDKIEESESMRSEGKELSGLRGEIERQIRASGYAVNLCLYDYATGEWVEIDARKPFYPASMIKILLLLAALEQAEQGALSLGDTHALTEEDKFAGATFVDGDGILKETAAGSVYTLEELLSLMVSLSDNVATNILFDRVGPIRINATARRLGLKNTAFTRKMYDLASPLPSNISTAFDLTKLLLALENREAAGDGLSRMAVQMMVETADKERIGRLTGDKVVVANKVGTVNGIVGDMALIYFPHRRPAALTIVVREHPEREKAARLIADLSRTIFNYIE